MPGGRRRWIVTMKFIPVKIDEKPRMKTAIATQKTPVDPGLVVVEYGV